MNKKVLVATSSNATTPGAPGDSSATADGGSELDETAEVLLDAKLTQWHDQILQLNLSWESYQSAGLLTAEDVNLIRRYDKKAPEMQRTLLEQEGESYAAVFMKIITALSTPDAVKYGLTLIDDALQADENRADTFLALSKQRPDWPINRLVRTLADGSTYIAHRSSRILSILLLKEQRPKMEEVHAFIRWLCEQLRKSTPEDLAIAVSALNSILRRNDYRLIFRAEDGIQCINGLLKNPRASIQLIYQSVSCLWLLSFNPDVAAQFTEPIVGRLVDLLKTQAKEKIQRVVLATLRNLLGKGTANQQMIEAGAVRVLDYFSARRWGMQIWHIHRDEDIVEDIDLVREALAKDVILMSSFDVYKREILSGNLEWSPVHRSEKFWRENVSRLEENQYQVLKALVEILRTSSDAQNLTIACFDMGEFARFHPRGRAIIKDLDAKTAVMTLMTHPDQGVQKEALLAVQKMMVNNWEYLSR